MASEITPKTPALPPSSIVLVAGVTGYIASHVADALLAIGYRIRGTVRYAESARWIDELFGSRHEKGRSETTAVTDMAMPGAFGEAVKGVAGVANVASVLSFSLDPNAVILDPANQQGSTGGFVRELLRGGRLPMYLCPSQHYIAVKDAVLLHVAALIDPGVRNERIMGFAAPWSWNEILAILRQVRPDKKIPKDVVDEKKDITKISSSRGAALLQSFELPS